MKKVITADYIQQHRADLADAIEVDGNTIITPAAIDYAKEHQIKIIRTADKTAKSVLQNKEYGRQHAWGGEQSYGRLQASGREYAYGCQQTYGGERNCAAVCETAKQEEMNELQVLRSIQSLLQAQLQGSKGAAETQALQKCAPICERKFKKPGRSGTQLADSDLLSVQEARKLAQMTRQAQAEFAKFSEEQVDSIIRSMVKAAADNAEYLAKMAVNETGYGKVADKITKNRLASVQLYDDMQGMKVAGIINSDPQKKIVEIAVPVGVLLGVVPSTNPTATVIYKALIALKARNGIVFSPHPSARESSCEAARIMAEAAEAAGAPEGIITCLSQPSMAAIRELFKLPEIDMIIATGGEAMVRAAYSSGKPALGVGPGNGPCFIERTACITDAVRRIIASKTFDYGTI